MLLWHHLIIYCINALKNVVLCCGGEGSDGVGRGGGGVDGSGGGGIGGNGGGGDGGVSAS